MKLMERLKRSKCTECGAKGTRLHQHHDDYAKPDETRQLCAQCHSNWHSEHGHAANYHLKPVYTPRLIDTGRVMNSAATAKAISVSPATLCRWRNEGYGPVFMRIGPATIRYKIADVENWLAELNAR